MSNLFNPTGLKPDPKVEQPHPLSTKDLGRAKGTPQNGNRHPGALGNDLVNGRTNGGF